jgi:hypothetical protein
MRPPATIRDQCLRHRSRFARLLKLCFRLQQKSQQQQSMLRSMRHCAPTSGVLDSRFGLFATLTVRLLKSLVTLRSDTERCDAPTTNPPSIIPSDDRRAARETLRLLPLIDLVAELLNDTAKVVPTDTIHSAKSATERRVPKCVNFQDRWARGLVNERFGGD